MDVFKRMWLNLILECDGLLRILNYREDKVHPLDIRLFLLGYQKRHYVLNWIVYKCTGLPH